MRAFVLTLGLALLSGCGGSDDSSPGGGGSGATGGSGGAGGSGGSINGYHTQAFHFRQTNTTIVSIVNQDGSDPNELTLAALQTLFP